MRAGATIGLLIALVALPATADEIADAIDRYLASRRAGDLASMGREARSIRERGDGARTVVCERLAESTAALGSRLEVWSGERRVSRARRVREEISRSLRSVVGNGSLLPDEGARDSAITRAVERARAVSALPRATTTREYIAAEGFLEGWSSELDGLAELGATLGIPLGSDPAAAIEAAVRPLDPDAADPGTREERARDLEIERENAAAGLGESEQALLTEIGDYRAAAGLPRLRAEPRLAAAARSHAAEMAEKGYFAHRSPTKGRARPADRVAAEGYAWASVGEVLARGDVPPRAILEAWWASPAHHRALLLGDVDEAGVARVGEFWVAVFARKRR